MKAVTKLMITLVISITTFNVNSANIEEGKVYIADSSIWVSDGMTPERKLFAAEKKLELLKEARDHFVDQYTDLPQLIADVQKRYDDFLAGLTSNPSEEESKTKKGLEKELKSAELKLLTVTSKKDIYSSRVTEKEAEILLLKILVGENPSEFTFNIPVGAESKIQVIEEGDYFYKIKFSRILNRPIPNPAKPGEYELVPSAVNDHDIYYMSKIGQHSTQTNKSFSESYSGFVHGPLAVPFKYRVDDGTLSGAASIGYYVGYGIEALSFDNFTLTPFLSLGTTGVSIITEKEGDAGKDEATNRQGVTIATGILFPSWGGANLGLIVGQDRIGDSDWEYEADTWVSISIGASL